MSRTRLMLLIAGAAVIWLVGAGNLVLSLTVGKARHARQIGRFTEQHQRDDAAHEYLALFVEAKRIREAMASDAADHGGLMGGAGMTIGILVLCWAIDRHRLMKRMAALGSRAKKTEVG